MSEAQLGEVLVHHSGKRAGQPIGAGAASAVVDSLEGLGWLRIHRREGRQGRNVYEVLERAPIETVVESGCAQTTSVEQGSGGSGVGDGSGSQAGDGSLATEEDLQTDGLVHEGRLISSAVGEATVVAREAAVENPQPNDAPASSCGGLALRADEHFPSLQLDADQRDAYTGPELTFSPRLAWVMEPVAWLVQRVPAFVQRAFARQLGAQLAEGVEPERLRSRLQSRFARTSPALMRSVEGWLLKVAAVRWGCHDPRCEEGMRWHSGEQCAECLAVRLERRAVRDRQQLLEAGLCPDCRCRLAEDGRCWTCQPASPPRPKPTQDPSPSTEHNRGTMDGLPYRCLDCGSWTESRADTGRCRRCAVRFAVREAEDAAMGAACAGLLAGEKLAAAARACAEVRRRVSAAREAAIAAGVDQEGQDVCAVAAAAEAAGVWTAVNQLVGAA
ncbi:hypothetical protein ACFWBC_39705 [Streptomyces sp. NPDC059985]|uniref:hypothetical protein n=1 Tax=Streptomyces sp. NPDC059985 TaxID=3347025 RepID=UPI003681CFE4